MDKTKRMAIKKNIIKTVSLMAAFMLLSAFCACKQENNPQNDLTYISAEELKACETAREITPENWEEFFEYQVEEKYWQKLGTSYYNTRAVVLKKECRMLSEEILLSLEADLVTKEIVISQEGEGILKEKVYPAVSHGWELSFTSEKSYNGIYTTLECLLNILHGKENPEDPENPIMVPVVEQYLTEHENMRCLKASGSVFALDIPEKYWNTDEEGYRYLLVGDPAEAFRIYEVTLRDDYERFIKRLTEENE